MMPFMKTALIGILCFLTCIAAAAAEEEGSGAWAAELDGGQLQITLFGGGRRGPTSRTFVFDEPLARVSGLSKLDLTTSGANVQFRLRRAAGTIVFEGRVAGGAGAGSYRFTSGEHRNVDPALFRDFDGALVTGVRVAHH